MSAYWGTEDLQSPALDFDFAESVTVAFAPGQPIDVKSIVLVIKEVGNGAETITVAVRNVDDSSSTTLGTFAIPNPAPINGVFRISIANVKTAVTGTDASQVADVTTGRVLGIQENQPGVAEVDPGQEIVLTSTGGTATTGQAWAFFEYVAMGNNPDRLTATALTFTHA